MNYAVRQGIEKAVIEMVKEGRRKNSGTIKEKTNENKVNSCVYKIVNYDIAAYADNVIYIDQTGSIHL